MVGQVTRTPLIAGNWKMQGSIAFVQAFLRQLKEGASKTSVNIALFPPFIFLSQVKMLIENTSIQLGAQNVSEYAEGAYTGEISSTMLNDCGCHYVLVGHSERRELYHETNEQCLEKVIMAQKAGLTPILCVGETLSAREEARTFGVIEEQLSAVMKSLIVDKQRLIVAYEPVWAIGTGKTATAAQAQEVHRFIREKISAWTSPHIADHFRLLYGGSVKPENAGAILAEPDVDGALVGGASLSVESFMAICDACS